MPIPNAAFLNLYWVVNGQLAINVVGAKVVGAPVFNQALANTLGTAIKSSYSANLGTVQPNTTSLVRVGIRDARQDHQPEFRDAGAAVSGTQTLADPLPTQTALCITLRTALSGKSYRGRIYFGGFSESANDATGKITSGVPGQALAFVTGIDNALTASGLDLAVVSRPAERYTITKTTFHADGSTTADIIGRGNARSGGAEVVTITENRNTFWETIRTRSNSRGALPTVFDANMTRELEPAS